MIDGIQNVHIYVTDMQRSVAFYEAFLGCAPAERDDYWTSWNFKGVQFALHLAEDGQVPPVAYDDHGPLSGGALTFKSNDTFAEVERLKKLGAKQVSPVRKELWGDLAMFLDPDENVIQIMKPNY